MKALWLSDEHQQCGQHIYLLQKCRFMGKNKSSKVVGENKTEKTLNLRIGSFCLKKKKRNGSLKHGEYLSVGASILVLGEGLLQILATHTHLAAGSRIHFAIFFLEHTWPCPQVLDIGKPFYWHTGIL